jgi:type I restriction enzyme S subunit
LDGRGGFRFEKPRYIPRKFADGLNKGRIQEGDVLVVKDGATTGKVSLVRPGFPFEEAYVNEHVFICRPGPQLDPRFLYYYLASSEGQRGILSDFRGAAQGGISRRFADLVLIPPIARMEQTVLADEIETESAHLDAAEEQLRIARAKLDVYERLVLAAAIRQPPDGAWPTAVLGNLARVGTGSTPLRSRSEYWLGGTVPWVTSGQLNDDFVTAPASYVTNIAVSAARLRLWPEHTLLVAMYGEGRTRGKCSELLIEATCNQACAAIVLDPEAPLRRDFLKLFLQAQYETHRKMAAGGVQPNLNLSIVRGWVIPLPTLDEQDRIVRDTAAALSVLSTVRETMRLTLKRAQALRQRIVSAALSSVAGN